MDNFSNNFLNNNYIENIDACYAIKIKIPENMPSGKAVMNFPGVALPFAFRNDVLFNKKPIEAIQWVFYFKIKLS